MAACGPQSHPRILQRRSEILDGVPSRRRWIGAAVASVLLVAVGASVGLGYHPQLGSAASRRSPGRRRPRASSVRRTSPRPVRSGSSTFSRRASASPSRRRWGRFPPAVDVAEKPIVVVRTTVLNHAATPYDMDAVLGPSASYDGQEVERLTDSRYGVSGVGGVVPPGHHSVYETTFPAGSGHLTAAVPGGFRVRSGAVRRSRALRPSRRWPPVRPGGVRRPRGPQPRRRPSGRTVDRVLCACGGVGGEDGVPGCVGGGDDVQRGRGQCEQCVDGSGDGAVAANVDDHGFGGGADCVSVRSES